MQNLKTPSTASGLFIQKNITIGVVSPMIELIVSCFRTSMKGLNMDNMYSKLGKLQCLNVLN